MALFDIELDTVQNPRNAFIVSSFIEVPPWKQHLARVLEVAEEVCKIIGHPEAELSFDGRDLLGRQTTRAVDDRRLVADPLFAVQQLEKFRTQFHGNGRVEGGWMKICC